MANMSSTSMPPLTLGEANQLEKRKLASCDLAVRGTVIRTENSTAMNIGDKFWVTHSGELVGFTGGGCVRGAIQKAAVKVTQHRKAKLVRSVPKEKVEAAKQDKALDVYSSSCPSKGEVDIFLEPVSFRPKTVILGTSDLARFTAALAKDAGYDVQLSLDDGEGGVSSVHNPDFIIIATQGVGDKDALMSALSTTCPSIFFVASQKKADHLGSKLKAEDVSGWERVISPAGLNIGAQGPVEIAISIMAQLIQLGSSNEKAGS